MFCPVEKIELLNEVVENNFASFGNFASVFFFFKLVHQYFVYLIHERSHYAYCYLVFIICIRLQNAFQQIIVFFQYMDVGVFQGENRQSLGSHIEIYKVFRFEVYFLDIFGRNDKRVNNEIVTGGNLNNVFGYMQCYRSAF